MNSEDKASSLTNVHSPYLLPPMDQSGDEIDLFSYIGVLNRHRLAIFGIFLLTVVITCLYVYQTTPRYTAHADLTLDMRKFKVVNIEDVLSGIPTNESVIKTEMDIIASTSLLSRVAKKLGLAGDPEFNPQLKAQEQDQNPFESFKEWLSELWFLSSDPEKVSSPEEQEQALNKAIVTQLRNDLKVNNKRASYVIAISFTSTSPKRAAQVVNTIAKEYLTDQLEAKFQATRRANEWLAKRLEDLRREVLAAELAVKQMREKAGIVRTGTTTILEQRISELNAQLIQARTKRARAEARYRRALTVARQLGKAQSLPEVLRSEVIQKLRAEEVILLRKKAELNQRYGPKHPRMIQLEAEIRGLESKIQKEVSRILESMANEVQAAHAEESALENSMDELKRKTSQTLQAELQLRELERRAEAARTLYQNFLGRFQETKDQEGLQRPDARVISWAEIPTKPSYPKIKLSLLLSMVVGLMLGIGDAFLLEALDRGFRTAEQVERSTGLPILGLIPSLGRGKGFPDKFVLSKPYSALSESARNVRASVQLSNVDNPPKTVLITSSVPMEGKTSLCLAMGHVVALSGIKTLLIDADLRRGPIAKRVSLSNLPEARLEDVLRGKASIKEALIKDEDSGLHLILGHGKTPTAGELLASKRMETLLRRLTESYDLILIDTPPVMSVSDALSLSPVVDALIYVVRWAETPREVVRSGLNLLRNFGIHITGIVLSQVDITKHAKYDSSGYGYYYGKYKKRYQDS